jgi:hypothetical protein
VQTVDATSVVSGQLATVQHWPAVMHVFVAAQIVSPEGQLHVPPGDEQVSPVTPQLELSQHVPVVMHDDVPPIVQPVLPAGHEQVPPGPEHVEPAMLVQSVVVQQLAVSMHVMFAEHSFCPVGHAHMSPGPGQCSPVIVQSLLVQQVPVGMQMSEAAQYCLPVGQASVHVPPVQMWPGKHSLPQLPQLSVSVPSVAQ